MTTKLMSAEAAREILESHWAHPGPKVAEAGRAMAAHYRLQTIQLDLTKRALEDTGKALVAAHIEQSKGPVAEEDSLEQVIGDLQGAGFLKVEETHLVSPVILENKRMRTHIRDAIGFCQARMQIGDDPKACALQLCRTLQHLIDPPIITA